MQFRLVKEGRRDISRTILKSYELSVASVVGSDTLKSLNAVPTVRRCKDLRVQCGRNLENESPQIRLDGAVYCVFNFVDQDDSLRSVDHRKRNLCDAYHSLPEALEWGGRVLV